MAARAWAVVLVALTAAMVMSSDVSTLEVTDVPLAPLRDVEPLDPKTSNNIALVEETAKAGMQAGATVTIWDKQFATAKVSAAQAQLHRVVEKLVRRHPEILGEADTIKQFTKEPESLESISGGIEALRAVLDKVDRTREELQGEKLEVKENIDDLRSRCATDSKNARDTIATKEAALSAGKTEIDQKRTRISELREQIKGSQNTEAGEQASSYESQMSEKRKQLSRSYSEYWSNTDRRSQTRDVLMQAIWLVCYGFQSFASESFCVDLRREPDYSESLDAPLEARGLDYKHNLEVTGQFAEVMRPLWKQQKLADLHMANDDGDPTRTKGFQRGKAPLGITAEAQEETDELIQQQVGVTDGTSNVELASRFEALLEKSNAPDNVAIPVQGLVQLLQTTEGSAVTAQVKDTAKSLVQMLARLDRELGQDQVEADDNWHHEHKSMGKETHGLLQQMEQEGLQQDRAMQEIATLEDDMRTIRSTLHSHEASIALSAKQMNQVIEDCESDYVEEWARHEALEEELVNIMRLNSLLRFLAVGDDPAAQCTADSGVPCDKGPQHGSCTWKTRGEVSDPNHAADGDQSAAFCACEPGYYGTNCELKKCPGLGHLLYKQNQDGVCSNRGGDCDGKHCGGDELSSGCNDDGTCTCNDNYYSGEKNKCEHKYCKDDDGEKTNCGGQPRGQCNEKHGVCECGDGYYGDTCQMKKCPATNPDGSDPGTIIGYFKGGNPMACDGRGACNEDGTCSCGHYAGLACEDACGRGENAVDCSGGRGTCQAQTGLCQCTAPYSGSQCTHGSGHCADCRFVNCPGGCSNGGYCDRIVGQCTCYEGNYNGARCDQPNQMAEKTIDWSRSMDKWGWSVCPEGFLLSGLSRDLPYSNGEPADALYNIKEAKCRKPSDGSSPDVMSQNGDAIELGHCYHENWWKKFDTKGGKFCRRNYFVAGLFRSHCNSLYCLEMAKCCQVKRSVWNDCKWTRMSEWKDGGKFSEIERSATGLAQGFIAGFYRSNSHTLDGLQHMRQCVPVFWGADNRDN